MILLKKFISFTIAVLSLGLFLCGCASKNSSDDGSKTEATSQPFTERQVDTAEGTFIFDNAGLLSADDLKACNDYAGWLYSYKLINTAVVTTNDLGGKSPSDFALEQYNKIYEGKGSGLLVVINNDTNEDSIWRTGSCLSDISQTSEDNAVYWATKEIVGGSYRRGIIRLLQLGELCTDHVVDNTQVFSYDVMTSLDKALASCKSDITLLASRNGSSISNEDVLKSYYKRKYKNGEGIMLMADTNTKTMIAYSEEKTSAKFNQALIEANKLTAKNDYFGAVNKIVESLDGKTASVEKTE